MASDDTLYSERIPGRSIVSLSGDAAEQEDFLQSLVTNDVSRAAPDTLVYAALLTPQGKYLSDFLIRRSEEGDFLIDVATDLSGDLVKRLTMYRLRRPLDISCEAAAVTAFWNAYPGVGFRDPRDPALGWRVYGDAAIEAEAGDYDLHRLKLGIPESGIDLVVGDSYALEAGFERLNGVDFRKGCYVGQEIVARMKFKTDLRKGLCTVSVSGPAPPMTALLAQDGKAAGTLHSNRDGYGIAHLRFDRATHPMTSSDAALKVVKLSAINILDKK